MCKFLAKISTLLYLLTLIACSVTYTYQDTVDLPIGTTFTTALQIAESVWADNFMQKISDKFPNFNPLENPQTQGINLFTVYGRSPDKKEKREGAIFIKLSISSTGKIDNAEEIVKYGKTIVQKAVEDYFK
jgi:hypothetical protein